MTPTKCPAVTGPGEVGSLGSGCGSLEVISKPTVAHPPLPAVSLLQFQLPVVNCSLKMLNRKFWK